MYKNLKPLNLLVCFSNSLRKTMAFRCGSFSRSLISTVRVSTARTSSSLPRLPSPPLRSHHLHSRRLLSNNPRTLGVFGCAQSLLPLHSVVASSRLTSHITVEARACCELSQGT
ncbi:uncharacterized protein LOC132266946 isoform X2 [Cornus florida]|nr:uncharacterized protein LOC132266946 isoform X2 [Cornus florida]